MRNFKEINWVEITCVRCKEKERVDEETLFIPGYLHCTDCFISNK